MKFFHRQFFLAILVGGAAISSTYEVCAQSVLEKRLTIKVKNREIGDVLSTIERMERVKFTYNPKSIPVHRKVSFNYADVTLREILDGIFTPLKISFHISGDYIVLRKTTATREQTSTLLGEAPTVYGSVTNDKGEALPAVNIVVKHTTIGTTTDEGGNYELTVAEGAETLVFTFIGYHAQEIPIQNRTVIDIVMMPDVTTLQEVVVVGYGTVEKEDVTGAIASIQSNVITQTTHPDAAGALQGRVPGVNIEKNVGMPGSGYQITVRGLGSISNSNSPLYVIDGIPTTEGITDLNPNDIARIDVLKDASATAIYGSRGANGVVVVTTKKGKAGKFSIQYDGNFGVRTPRNLPDMMNGEEYVQWRTDLFRNEGKGIDRSNPEFFTEEEWETIDRGEYTDWIDLILSSGLQISNTISASGGDEKGTFALSIGQHKEEGSIPTQHYTRYNMRLNLSRKFLSKWEAGGNLYFAKSVQNQGSWETLRSAYRLPPVAKAYDENGEPKFFVWRNDFVTNPLFENGPDGEIRENSRFRGFGNVYLQVEPFGGLTLRSQLAPQAIFDRNGYYGGQWWKGGAGKIEKTNANLREVDYFGYVLDNQLTYLRRIGQHHFNASLVQSLQFEQWDESYQEATNFPFNSKWHNLDAVPVSNVRASETDYRQRSLMSVLGRLQYSLSDRYLFTISGRYDGSSRLAEGNKWAFFPSAAFAWRISEESFLQGVQQLDALKLRLSYGISGNDAVSIYGTQSNVAPLHYDFNGTVAPAYYKSGLTNNDLTWEKTAEINIGLDYGLFADRIFGSIDVYKQNSQDLIMQRQLPTTTGWTSVWDNVGWVKNTGIEVAVSSVNIQSGNFSWRTDLIFDSNKNKIVELYNSKKDDVGNKWFIGHPIQVNYDYVFDGIWQLDESDLAAKYGQSPGQVKVRDLDANGVIDANDRQVIGQRTPKWSGSITNSFKYKNWDLSVYIYTRQGEQLFSTFRSTYLSLEGNYKNLDVDYWTESNPTNDYPQPGNKGRFFNAFQYADVSFVRVGNLSLSYHLPQSFLKRMKMQQLRIHATATNPFTFTSYEGYDPEWGDQNTWGEATGSSTYLLGVSIEF